MDNNGSSYTETGMDRFGNNRSKSQKRQDNRDRDTGNRHPIKYHG